MRRIGTMAAVMTGMRNDMCCCCMSCFVGVQLHTGQKIKLETHRRF